MRKIIIFGAAFFLFSAVSYAQDTRYGYSSVHYNASYYSPVLWGVNGHRSVEEENRIMEQTLAELRRQRERENMTPDEHAEARKRREIRLEIKNDAMRDRKEKEDAAKVKKVNAKPPQVKKDTVVPASPKAEVKKKK